MTAPDVIATQRAALLDLYRRHVGPDEPYALVDFPDHPNVGDSAIWLGEIAMLRAVTGRDPSYACTWADFDEAAFRQACPTGVVFIHGGGNLGDIWVHHQDFRETVLTTLRDRRVVQLPQSIRFRDTLRIAQFAAAVAEHPDFHLYVRDRRSLAVAERHVRCPVTLAPDSAFALGPQPRGVADCDVLSLLRTDDERVVHECGTEPGAVVVDWLEDGPLPTYTGLSRVAYYHRLAGARVDRGMALLSRGRRIVTDRLHGHILATLLGIPHVALDNDYGKVSAYIAAWTATSPLVSVATPAKA